MQGSRLAVEAQQTLPAGTGYGYHLRADDGRDGAVSGVARYQGAHGRYEVRQERFGAESVATLSAMGAFVGIGGRVHATRPVAESFALVRVPGVKGVRTFASHQEIGRTGAGGDLLVPDLQAYYGNILNVADGDIPLEYAVSTVGMTLAPPYRGGAVALFDVRRVQHVIGRIQSLADSHSYAYGELTAISATGARYQSPLGSDGSFYFENLPAGTYSGQVAGRSASCRFTMHVPQSRTSSSSSGPFRTAYPRRLTSDCHEAAARSST